MKFVVLISYRLCDTCKLSNFEICLSYLIWPTNHVFKFWKMIEFLLYQALYWWSTCLSTQACDYWSYKSPSRWSQWNITKWCTQPFWWSFIGKYGKEILFYLKWSLLDITSSRLFNMLSLLFMHGMLSYFVYNVIRTVTLSIIHYQH